LKEKVFGRKGNLIKETTKKSAGVEYPALFFEWLIR
jgi:hypothetical protein